MTIETNTETAADETSATTTTTTSDPSEQGSSSSTTESPTDDKIDLGVKGEAETKTETKDEVEQTPEEKAAAEARATLFGAPAEDAEYEISGLPEGMEIDKEAVAAVAPIARELDLSNEGFSKLANAYAEHILPRVAQQAVSDIETRIVAQRAVWEGEARDLVKGKDAKGEAVVAKNAAGEVLGFDDRDMKSVASVAAKALDRLAPAGFREFLEETGLGVNPQMIAFAYQAGKAITEDQTLETATTTTGAVRREDKYYPKS